MIHTVDLLGKEIKYTIRTHPRAKRTSVTVYPDGTLVATIPRFATDRAALRLIQEKREWILRNIFETERELRTGLPRIFKKDIPYLKEQARIYIHFRLKYFQSHYGFSYNHIFVKDMKSQWGSCSYKKNLNYNFRLLFLPEGLADALIVHELCHLKEMNHSKYFWKLVGETVKDFRKKERELHRYLIK